MRKRWTCVNLRKETWRSIKEASNSLGVPMSSIVRELLARYGVEAMNICQDPHVQSRPNERGWMVMNVDLETVAKIREMADRAGVTIAKYMFVLVYAFLPALVEDQLEYATIQPKTGRRRGT